MLFEFRLDFFMVSWFTRKALALLLSRYLFTLKVCSLCVFFFVIKGHQTIGACRSNVVQGRQGAKRAACFGADSSIQQGRLKNRNQNQSRTQNQNQNQPKTKTRTKAKPEPKPKNAIQGFKIRHLIRVLWMHSGIL